MDIGSANIGSANSGGIAYFPSPTSAPTLLPHASIPPLLSALSAIPALSPPPTFILLSVCPHSPYLPLAVLLQQQLQDAYFRAHPGLSDDPSAYSCVACPFDAAGEPDLRVHAVLDTLLSPSPSLTAVILVADPAHREAAASKAASSPHSSKVATPTVSSRRSLLRYCASKNAAYEITAGSTVLLSSSLSFDPCYSDVVATLLLLPATLALPPPPSPSTPSPLLTSLHSIIASHSATHLLTTPAVFSSLSPPAPPSLSVISLGGEPLPPPLARAWARETPADPGPRLFATYGVTECCVYQTCGEVLLSSPSSLGSCGLPFPGVSLELREGELVVGGAQLDAASGYYGDPALTAAKFFGGAGGAVWYRTGDAAALDAAGRLAVRGRLDGQVKVNGARVELGEAPANLLRFFPEFLRGSWCKVEGGRLVGYVELGESLGGGAAVVLAGTEPLHRLLSGACARFCKPGTAPTSWVVLTRPSVGATGKVSLPPLSSCAAGAQASPTLAEALPGSKLARHIAAAAVDCLNLSPSLARHITPSARLQDLGADSLTSTRILRQAFALFNGVQDSRHLQGEFGAFEEDKWGVSELLGRTLGDWVRFVEGESAGGGEGGEQGEEQEEQEGEQELPLFDALMDAITLGQSAVAVALIEDLGVDPNANAHKGRIGKSTTRDERKAKWAQTPLHIAAFKADKTVLAALLRTTKNLLIPDASASFPIHNLCLGTTGTAEARFECLRMFLERVPLTVRDGNKATLVTAAARGGNAGFLKLLVDMWMAPPEDAGGGGEGDKRQRKQKHPPSLDERDRWHRTPVHWAVLNSHEGALRVLLDAGASRDPFWRGAKASKRTSAAIESPMDIAVRVHGQDSAFVRLLAPKGQDGS